MKEHSINLDLFQLGLRAEALGQLNKPGLFDCVGYRLGPSGLEADSLITNPITASEGAYDWPFPQLFRFASQTYLLTRHYLYLVGSTWALTQGPAWFYSGQQWDGLDFHTFVVFVNGTMNIIVDPTTGDFRFATVAEFPTCSTACNFKGQVVVGNTAKGVNWVEWGAIGSLEFDWDRRNEAGGMPMPWNGEVFRVRQIGSNVMVYGDGGIVLLKPIAEPVVGFGMKKMALYGIMSRGAVGGNNEKHLLIDEAGNLRKATTDGIQYLGYREFFAPMVGKDIVIEYNPIDDEFYISDGTVAYCYTERGLTRMRESISGGALFDGVFVGISYSLGESYRTVVSNPFDFGIRGSKAITYVWLNADTSLSTQVAIDWRTSGGGSFNRTGFRPVSPEGFVEFPIEGTEFKLVVRTPVSETTDLGGEVTIGYQVTDKRSIRGTYAPSEGSARAVG